MKVEIPELKTCCLCFPLRPGLIAFGYLKLILGLLFIAISINTLVSRSANSHVSTEDILVITIFLLILVPDVCLSIVFLIGGHRKSAKLLHVCYIYNIIDLVIYVIFLSWTTVTELATRVKYAEDMPEGYANLIPMVQVNLLIDIGFIGFQIYITLLVRSEVIKLKNISKFRSTNLQDKAECLENGTNKQDTEHTNETTNEN